MLPARFEETRGALVVTPLVRRLDADAAPALREVVGERARGRAVVVLSLAHVRAVDASGLAAIVSVLKRMAPGGELRIARPCGPLRALLARTHLDLVFPLFDDEASALPG
jgi:anti-sigma B factor antagonist